MTTSVVLLGTAALLTAAIVTWVYGTPQHRTRRPPALDARTERELRTRYLDGRISIGDYLDRRFGTGIGPGGERRRAG